MNKGGAVVFSISIFSIVIIVLAGVLYQQESASVESSPTDNQVATETKEVKSESDNTAIRQQLEDVKQKIEELPELEEDIFSKCIEGKRGTQKQISQCQEKTQTKIHTLSQDLTNLKQNLESKLH